MSERESIVEDRNAVEQKWTAFMSGERTVAVREEILSSWQRTRKLISPATSAPPTVDALEDPEPLLRSVHILDRELQGSMADAGLLVALTDARGQIVWTAGEPDLLRLAETGNFAPGALWDEANMGTNAVSMALTSGGPAAVWSAEHWSSALHFWSCYAAPIHHPESGRRLGVLNFSTTWDNGHPLVSAAVIAWADLLAPEIARHGQREIGPAPNHLSINVLGRQHVTLGGAPLNLTKRQTEILLLLALRPEGVQLEELHADLYGDAPVGVGTLKAEVSHLRRMLGGRISRTPYRLAGPVSVDVSELLDDVRADRIRDAASRYMGALLPWSESPRITRLAHTVEVAVRDAALATDDYEPALTLASRMEDDAELVEHVLRILPETDRRRHVLQGHLAAIA